MGFKSVKDKFQQVKQKIGEERKKPGSSYASESFFKPVIVKGETKAKYRIRILPLDDESPTGKPWVEIRYHMFQRQGDNKYIKVIDPRSFDSKAANPIADKAAELYSSDNALDKKQAQQFYRKPRYFVKVYVKEAPEANQDMVGKILIYEASKTLFDKWMDEIEETSEDEAPFWDPFEGKDFLLLMKQKGEWPDYSDSKFVGGSKPIDENEEKMEEVYKTAKELVIKNKILERDPIKTANELRECLIGGLKGHDDEVADTNTATEVTNDNAEIGSSEVDFGDDDVEKETPKASEKPKTEAKVEEAKDDDEIDNTDLDDVDFNDDDFDIK